MICKGVESAALQIVAGTDFSREHGSWGKQETQGSAPQAASGDKGACHETQKQRCSFLLIKLDKLPNTSMYRRSKCTA